MSLFSSDSWESASARRSSWTDTQCRPTSKQITSDGYRSSVRNSWSCFSESWERATSLSALRAILHLEIATLLPQHFSAEAVKLMAYGFHLGNREHLSSSPPLSGREAGFFFSLSIPMAKGGFGHFSSNFLKEIKKISPASKKPARESVFNPKIFSPIHPILIRRLCSLIYFNKHVIQHTYLIYFLLKS